MKGHIRIRNDRYVLVWPLPNDPQTGKRRQGWKTMPAGTTKKQAQKALTQILHDLNEGTYLEPSKLTVAQWLARWVEDYASLSIQPTTLRGYSQRIRCQLNPRIGQTPLDKLTTPDVQRLYRQLKEDGLAPGTIKAAAQVLKMALSQAVDSGMLKTNPATKAKTPQPKKTEINVLDQGQVSKLLSDLEGKQLYMPVYLALATGMRRGEILALKWEDVDLEDRKIMVRSSRARLEDGSHIRKVTKTERARHIAIGQDTVTALKAHHKAQAEQRLQAGRLWEPHGYVCTRWNGEPIALQTVTGHFRQVTERLKMRCRFHDLRHTHATTWLSKGENVKVVSERLGHSSINITLDIYSHLLPGIQEEAAARMDGVLGL